MTFGLVTGFQPFAGLPDSPSAMLLPRLDGRVVNGVTIRAECMPVSLADMPRTVARQIRAHRPVFVVLLGLAAGECVLRCETTAINRLDLGVADNHGLRPADGRPIDPSGPAARQASWDAAALTGALCAAGLPARVSHFAGTHLCNAALYTALATMEAEGLTGPCGFLHLPYLPGQVARFMSDAPAGGDLAPFTPRALPSMALDDQVAALRLILERLSHQTAP
jgi:pyroglutamyl-peptidase